MKTLTFLKQLRTIFLANCLLLIGLSGCDSGGLLDLAFNPPSRKPIDVSKVGVNNFFVHPEFGSISAQYSEIKNTLGIKFVRVLLAWTDDVQASPTSDRNYSFYDNILGQIPSGVDVLVVLVHTPSWMTNSSNWIGNDPRLTFNEQWVRPTVRRYKNVGNIIGWEIWNEPNVVTVASDSALELSDPANYAALLASASNIVHDEDPGALVVMAATESIQQNFPNNLNYNKQLKDLGVENFTDVWNVHYYGTRYESVITENGVKDFLNGVSKAIWVTETGETGPTEQLAYVETTWPFLTENINGIDRFYYYEFGDTVPIDVNFGLRTTDPTFPVSDLYIHLRDN